MLRALLFLLIFCLTACGPSLEDDVSELVAAKDRWIEVVGDRDYSFDYHRVGYNAISMPIVVDVRDGISQQVHPARPSREPDEVHNPPTMTEFFDLVLTLTEYDLSSRGILTVEYDQQLGFPATIRWKDREGFESSYNIKISNVSVNYTNGQLGATEDN